jgi:hypothetical protein
MDTEIEEVNSFREFFDELDEEFLIKLHLADPYNLHRLCVMYSLDLQMEKEEIANESFSNRRGMC